VNLPHIVGIELLEKVGEGGMGVVYRATHLTLQRTVAVKVLHQKAGEGGALPAWRRESRMMASLAHPNVVTIHDAGYVDGYNYLIMEYLAGGSLRSRMQPGMPWALRDAMVVLDCIARALCHIHQQGVLHLDLKPENILCTSDGQIKISDFSLSVPEADSSRQVDDLCWGGTVDYCAPEQRFGLSLDTRCDVFSLAAVAYELLTGRPSGRVYAPASRHVPRLSPAIDDVLRRGLARDPSDRYNSIDQFWDALSRACHLRRPRRWRWPVGIAASLVAVAVALSVPHAMMMATPEQTAGPEITPASLAAPSSPPEQPGAGSAAETERNRAPASGTSQGPSQLWLVYDSPEDLSLLGDDTDGGLSNRAGVAVRRIEIGRPPPSVPPELALADWSTFRPGLIARSQAVWAYVHPLVDRTLAPRVLGDWPALLQPRVTPSQIHAKASDFPEGCLAVNHGGDGWRIGDIADWKASRQISVAPTPDEPGNSALVLTNLDPAHANDLLGCYQPIERAPAPGAITVLRYRARSQLGKATLGVYFRMSFDIPPNDTGVAASRIRRVGERLPSPAGTPTSECWLLRNVLWVVPTARWQMYTVVFDAPPFPSRSGDRNLVIDAAGTDQVWVDDVSLYTWNPGGRP